MGIRRRISIWHQHPSFLPGAENGKIEYIAVVPAGGHKFVVFVCETAHNKGVRKDYVKTEEGFILGKYFQSVCPALADRYTSSFPKVRNPHPAGNIDGILTENG